MSFFLRIILSILALGATQVLLTKYLNRPAWNNRWGRRLSIYWPLGNLAAILIWMVAVRQFPESWLLDSTLRMITAGFLVGLLAMVLALPISGIVHFGNNLFDKFLSKKRSSSSTGDSAVISESAPDGSEANMSRRRFLTMGASVFPAVAATGALGGVVKSFNDVRVFDLTLKFPNLPADLEGFKILHLSDLHLGVYFNLDSLESLLLDLEGREFDLVALVGDIADDLDSLSETLSMLSALPSRYGHFGTMGNHEYYRGADRVRRIYDRSPVPLLINQGQRIQVGSSALYLGGSDDPRQMGWSYDSSGFYRSALESSLGGAASDDFRLMLSHRPGMFDYSAPEKVDLTLAGHTHGGQLGMMGHSAFEMFGDDLYLWGRYQKGDSQLYTSSGVGHWFPFRLGCPAEAPIITLSRA
jgi:predicted MPP superfamily phosphohydrolase